MGMCFGDDSSGEENDVTTNENSLCLEHPIASMDMRKDTVSGLMVIIAEHKAQGAAHFKKDEYQLAINKYTDALEIAKEFTSKAPKDMSKQMVILYSNLSLCNLKLEKL